MYAFCDDLNRTGCSPSSKGDDHASPTPQVAPPSPTPMGQRGGGGGRSFSSAPYQTETGIFRNFYGNSHWSASLIVQLASLVGWVKLSNLSMWGINVSHGSLIVSIGHVGVDMQYCSTRYALGGIITMHLLLAPSFQEARASMAEYISISYNSFQKITLFS